jgi:flagellar hook-associated protein 2
MSSSSVDGLVSGLQTSSLIQQLLAAERAPQDRLVANRDKAKQTVTAYQSLNTKLAALRDASSALATTAGWGAMKATSSATSVATATTSAGALGGSLAFTVNRLATSSSIISTGTVASLTSQITSGHLLVSAGGPALGVATFSGAGLTLGAHAVKVTQASAAATKTASGALLASTAIAAMSNDTIDVEIDGVAKTYTIAPNAAYTRAQLAAAIQTASGGDLNVSVDATNHLVFTTVDEGSQASLKITGGTALTDVGLTGGEVGGSASLGVDGVIDVDGTTTTISNVVAGASTGAMASGTGGTVTAVLAGGLRLGTVNAKNVDTEAC